MAAQDDTRGFLREVLRILREDLNDAWQLSEQHEALEPGSAQKSDFLSLGPMS